MGSSEESKFWPWYKDRNFFFLSFCLSFLLSLSLLFFFSPCLSAFLAVLFWTLGVSLSLCFYFSLSLLTYLWVYFFLCVRVCITTLIHKQTYILQPSIMNTSDFNSGYRNNNSNISRADHSVSSIRRSSFPHILHPLPVDPRPQPIPRPARDSHDLSSDVAHTTRCGNRGRAHYNTRNARNTESGSYSSARKWDGSDHRRSCHCHHDPNGNGGWPAVVHRIPSSASSSHRFEHRYQRPEQRYSSLSYRDHQNYTRHNSNDESLGRYRHHKFRSRNGLVEGNSTSQDRLMHHHGKDVRTRSFQRRDSSANVAGHRRIDGSGFSDERYEGHWTRSVLSRGSRNPSLTPVPNGRGPRPRFSNSSAVHSSGTPGRFSEMVVDHAMDLLRQRQSEVPIDVDHAFWVPEDQSSELPQGALQSEAKRLPSFTLVGRRRRASRPSSNPPSEVCVICTETVGAHDKLTVLPCGHTFHCGCINTWTSIRRTCPLCRKEL